MMLWSFLRDEVSAVMELITVVACVCMLIRTIQEQVDWRQNESRTKFSESGVRSYREAP